METAEEEAFERLNDIWGDDKDGKYEELYNNVNKLEFYKYGESLGIKINDLQRLMLLAKSNSEPKKELSDISDEDIRKAFNQFMEDTKFMSFNVSRESYKAGAKWMQDQLNKEK